MFDSKSKAQRRRILLVEDEEHLARGIKFNLQAEGYEVEHVGDGSSAVRTVQSATPPFDLIVLDLMLPGMSGYAVCESLRSGGHQTPVLILSARTLSEDRTRGFDVGADQYLTKPFDLDELLSRVKNLLTRFEQRRQFGARQEAAPPQPTFAFGKVRINFDTFEADVGGEPVRLTFLEMQLLKYFIANEGRVIPRNELIENVWQMPSSINTRAPDQFIRRLRKAFEPDASRPRHFLTIRDAGYRFVSKPSDVGPDDEAEHESEPDDDGESRE